MKMKLSDGLIDIGLVVRWLIGGSNTSNAATIKEQFERLKSKLRAFEFKVSLTAMESLISFTTLVKEMDKVGDKGFLTKETQKDLTEAVIMLEGIIVSEAMTKIIYLIPQRRYNGSYLLNSPESLLKDAVFGKLPDMAKFDFASACRCLSFGEGTACAFHILRATEEVLKHYYYKYKKTKRLDKPMWGPMTSQLRSKRSPNPSEEILSALDVVRISYRNPTQHPEAKYDIDQAQDLFGVCIDLINKMGTELSE